MQSGYAPGNKPILCRYFMSKGTCFYGDDCQFVHDQNRQQNFNPNVKQNNQGDGANNGDEFFTATFNGLPAFDQQYAQQAQQRKTEQTGGDVPSYLPQSQPPPPPLPAVPTTSGTKAVVDTRQLNTNFTAMNLETTKPSKGLKVGASEFIPKGLHQSSSSPSFVNYSQPPPNFNVPIMEADIYNNPSVRIITPNGPSNSQSPLVNRRNISNIAPIQTEQTEDMSQLAAAAAEIMTVENVGGTTYFYSNTEEAVANQGRLILPSFSVYSGMMTNVAHMKVKPNMPSFFTPDEMKMEILNKQAVIHADIAETPGIPKEVDNYNHLFPLEMPQQNPLHKSSTFGFQTSTYKANNTKDGLVYCLRRIHGFRLSSTKCMSLIDMWKKLQHSNIVSLREVFTTKAFEDNSMVFVFDYHPRAETLMSKHFTNNQGQGSMTNGYSNPYNIDGGARPYSAGKGTPRQHAGLLAESLIWSYIVQLSSALRSIHAQGLACRIMDPTKILLTDKSRLRLNCVGIFDVLSFDANQPNPLAVMPHYQQEDLVSLGKVVLALACNSVIGIQRDHIQTSLELVARNYSADLKNLILYLLTTQNRMKSVNDIMPMIGARFYTQLDAAQLRSDVIENELSKEVENSRLFRLVCKLGVINERPGLNMDLSWAETGDRYALKLFRDYLFHQVDEAGLAWIDIAHIVQCLNKFDAGSPEKICLTSRDGQSVIIVSYEELKKCFETSFNELLSSGQQPIM